jgi:hypothetical protein
VTTLTDGPTFLGDLLPALAVSIQESHGIHRRVGGNAPKHVILENNLTRKGVWSTDPSRDPHQAEITFETEDLVGKLVMESSLGRLSTTEMEMVSWIMAQWERQENPDDPWVHCSLKGLADAFGVTWSGSRAAFIKDGLERLHAVRFKAEVWNHKEGKLKTELFGIFDRVSIVERKDGFSARWSVEAGNAPVKIKLGDFLHQQLKLGQFHRYAWQVLRGKLKSPLAKRLYIFLDAQRGNDTAAGWLYEVRVNKELYVSLGVRDRNLSRARTRLREACAELLAADPSYKELRLREGADGGWVLRRLKTRPGGAPQRTIDAASVRTTAL